MHEITHILHLYSSNCMDCNTAVLVPPPCLHDMQVTKLVPTQDIMLDDLPLLHGIAHARHTAAALHLTCACKT